MMVVLYTRSLSSESYSDSVCLATPGSLRAEYLDLAQKLPLTLADVKRSSWTTHDQRMFNKPEDDKKRKL